MTGGVVVAVMPGSSAQAAGVRRGDALLKVNGHRVRDVLDVQFYAADEELDLLIHRAGTDLSLHVRRDYGLPLGLDFASPVFDGLYKCRNQCDFCFVSQMPPGMRQTLYVRDDDYRYSVLYGNFITLTRLTPQDWARLKEQRLSPLYVSVHSTEPELRRQILGKRTIPDVLTQIDRLADLGIELHAQIVLVPGVNDGPHLMRTLSDLQDRYPAIQSVGVVPVGLTRYHHGGCRSYRALEVAEIIAQIAPLQQACRDRFGLTWVYLSDEWYLLAGIDVPEAEAYDGYPQVENGIGLVRQFLDDSLSAKALVARGMRYTLICGTLIAPVMQRVVDGLSNGDGPQIDVLPVPNQLFGETVTVSGLLAGGDVVAALRAHELGDVVVLPRAMFSERTPDRDPALSEPGGHWIEGSVVEPDRDGTLRTLDDWTLREMEEAIQRPIQVADRMSEIRSCADRVPVGYIGETQDDQQS
jgi:putative radical SAM enzyme (TIGR03279 family)